ncbi:hypothetical protein [Ohtaekwangia koreensis]|uniref:hypothetical protein n=1 Tax=Ohtaekwangia koreensis TaxID=688867 RepID=UPI00373FCBBC
MTGCIYVFEEELKTFFYADREVITIPELPPSALVGVLHHKQVNEYTCPPLLVFFTNKQVNELYL